MEQNKNETGDRLSKRDSSSSGSTSNRENRPAPQRSPSLQPRRTPIKNITDISQGKRAIVSEDGRSEVGAGSISAKTSESFEIKEPHSSAQKNTPQKIQKQIPAYIQGRRSGRSIGEAEKADTENAVRKSVPASVSGKSGVNPSRQGQQSRTSGYTPHPATVTDKKTEKKGKKNKNNEGTSGEGGRTAVSSIIKAVIYIVCVLVVAVFLSYAIISVGNDMYALVKDDTVIEVELTDYMTISDIADLLHDNGLIEHPAVFEMYVGMKNSKREKKYEFISGTYEVSPSMSYDEFIKTFAHLTIAEREQVKITIPEGYTVDEIIELFLSNGMGTREGFVDAINNYDYGTDLRFLKELPQMTEDRKYRLEGYLFPDTYYFYKDSSESAIIYKLLETFELRVTEEYYTRAEEMQMTMDEVVTLASIIQAEAKLKEDFLKISAVLNNRLNHADQFPKLQSDATIQYILEERRVDLTVDDLKIDNKYNTYIYPGLPPSAIGNPGTEAINAALGPLQEYLDNGYYYFVSAPSGVTYYARTEAEHEANKAKIRNGEYK